MPLIRFIVNLFKKKQEEEDKPPEPPGRKTATIIKKVKIPLWLF
jgi:hypothetical protein